MRTLDRYLLREYLSYCALGAGTFVALFVVVDLFEKIDVFVDHKAALWTVVRYYACSSVTILTQVLPVSLLLGTLLALSQLRKHNEITAMQASGQSPWRLASPLLSAAALICLGQYALNELAEPQLYETHRRILNEEIKQISGADSESRSDVRLLGEGGRFYLAQFYDNRRHTLRAVSVQYVHPPSMNLRVDAQRAEWRDGFWQFEQGFRRVFQDSTVSVVPFRRYGASDLAEPPGDFARRNPDPFHLPMKELLRYAERLRQSGGETQKYLTDFHLRASFPLAGLILTLLGTGLSLRVLRGSNLALGFGLSVSIGFAYLALVRVGQALGYNGAMPPMPAAWLGNFVFLTLALVLFWKVSR